MREASVTRIAADLSFFFLIFNLFSPAVPEARVLLAFLAACVLFGFLSIRPGKALLRFFATLPPLLLLLAASAPATAVAVGAGWLYFTVMFTADRAGMQPWVYRKAFLIMAAAAAFACLLVSAALLFRVTAPGTVFLFSALFCLLGLHTLRAMRMGTTTDVGWKLYSILELILPAVLAGLIGAGLFRLFRLAGAVFEFLFTPFAYLIRWLNELLTSVFRSLSINTTIQEINDIVPPEAVNAPAQGPAPVSEEAAQVSIWLNAHPVPWKSLALALLFVAAAVVLILYLVRSRRVQNNAGNDLFEQRFQVFRKRRIRPAARDNAESIRSIYQDYLNVLQRRGREIRVSSTSKEITPEGSADEQRLRQLYLIARYGDGSKITSEEVTAARDCLERIRERA